MQLFVGFELPTRTWISLGRAAVLLALVVGLLGAMPAQTHGLRAPAALLALAGQKPETRISVIVQKASRDSAAEALTARLGGEVTKPLPIINAFAANVPGRAVPQLAAAPDVRWVSLDGPVQQASTDIGGSLTSAYPQAVGASRLWNEGGVTTQGQNVTIAVVDSGITYHDDLGGASGSRVIGSAKFSSNSAGASDAFGHGTHIAGIIAGAGVDSNGAYIGIAPQANLLNVKVSDDQGAALTSDLVNGLQWVLNNKGRYNIRVVNLSLNSAAAQSYQVDPIDAACEILWFNGIVVVASAGNNAGSSLTAPANDPFVITVGATDDRGTAGLSDDTVASFSAAGLAANGSAKPDLVAPGTNIVSLMAGARTTLPLLHPDHIVDAANRYFRMSGTSMAAPMVSGAAALLLSANPALTPDQVKFRLKASAVRDPQRWPAYDSTRAGAGYLDVYAAVHSGATDSANTGIAASSLLGAGANPMTWNSVNWGSVNWGSVNWGSVNWGSVNWGSDYWAP
jgi:serine protease AprX